MRLVFEVASSISRSADIEVSSPFPRRQGGPKDRRGERACEAVISYFDRGTFGGSSGGAAGCPAAAGTVGGCPAPKPHPPYPLRTMSEETTAGTIAFAPGTNVGMVREGRPPDASAARNFAGGVRGCRTAPKEATIVLSGPIGRPSGRSKHCPTARGDVSAGRSRCGRHPSRGQALTELALIAPIFILLFAATLDLGRIFYAQISINNAAREGAFQAARTPDSFQAGQPCDTATNLVVCRVLLESKDSFVEVSPADVAMSCDPASCAKAVGNTVTVTVAGQFTLVTPILGPFFNGQQSLPLTAAASAQLEVVPPEPTPGPTFGLAPTPTPTPTATPPSATPSPTPDCVAPPNVIGMSPSAAEAAIEAAGLVPVGYGDLTTGHKNEVQVQNPDSSQCVALGSTVTYHYRP